MKPKSIAQRSSPLKKKKKKDKSTFRRTLI